MIKKCESGRELEMWVLKFGGILVVNVECFMCVVDIIESNVC